MHRDDPDPDRPVQALGGATLYDMPWFAPPPEMSLTRHQVALRAEAQILLEKADTQIRALCDRAGMVGHVDGHGHDVVYHGQPALQRRPRSLGRHTMRVTVSLGVEDVTKLDQTAALLNVSRSQAVRGCLRFGRGHYERAERAYGALPVPTSKAAFETGSGSATPVRPRPASELIRK